MLFIYTLKCSCKEEHGVGIAYSKHQSAEEHDGQAKHHWPVIAYSIDDGATYWIDEDLNGSL